VKPIAKECRVSPKDQSLVKKLKMNQDCVAEILEIILKRENEKQSALEKKQSALEKAEKKLGDIKKILDE
jgi:hypothetical protein